jgi:YebC/PmpR family DNA-binding regulatory protein
MSGHSRWATIKHKKAASDAKKGRAWTKLIKEVTIAARMGGGDAGGNPRLRKAVDAARAANMPAENITRAIKRGTGELEGVSYEELTYEGIGPAGVLLLVDVVTDNRNRTAAEIRKIFEKAGGQMTGGAAAWGFDRKGQVRLEKKAATEEELFDIAIGAGAEDIAAEGDDWAVTTPVESVDAVAKALEAAKIAVKSAAPIMVPKNTTAVGGDEAQRVLNLVETLDDHDDVQNVWANFDVSEEELARLR